MALVEGYRLTLKWSLAVIALVAMLCSCAALPTLEPNSPVFNVTDHQTQELCISASFNLTFNIYVNTSTNDQEPQSSTVYSPTTSQEPTHTGSCSNDSMQYLKITWKDEYQFILTMNFTTDTTNGNWSLTRLALEFDPRYFSPSSDLVKAANGSTLVFETVETSWWNRTFTTNQFFYCKHCKELPFGVSSPVKNLTCVNNTEYCSYAGLKNAVIYVGTAQEPSKQQCLEDYLAIRELIVPIVVGGLLLLLLIVVTMAYLIAFLKRRFRDRHVHYHHLEHE